jgi:TDG/mug DNA glycosylase family protein
VGEYYAGNGNKFWQTLYDVKLTTKLISSSNYSDLLMHRIGLTDLVKVKSGLDNSLKAEDYDIEGFRAKIMEFTPKTVCFNGKKAAAIYFNLRNTKNIKYGQQNQNISSTKIFVAPSTSNAANAYWDIDRWKDLAKLC